MERELKLELQEDQLDRLRDLPALSSLRIGRPHDELHVNTYFDTADFELSPPVVLARQQERRPPRSNAEDAGAPAGGAL